MKRIAIFLMTLLVIAAVCSGCVKADKPNTKNTVIDYGTSDIYTKEDMNSAIELIKKQINGWEVAKVYNIRYAGDDISTDETEYYQADYGYDEVIAFTSDFHTAFNAGGAWNRNEDYDGWIWLLGRNDKGNWELYDWGWW